MQPAFVLGASPILTNPLLPPLGALVSTCGVSDALGEPPDKLVIPLMFLVLTFLSQGDGRTSGWADKRTGEQASKVVES